MLMLMISILLHILNPTKSVCKRVSYIFGDAENATRSVPNSLTLHSSTLELIVQAHSRFLGEANEWRKLSNDHLETVGDPICLVARQKHTQKRNPLFQKLITLYPRIMNFVVAFENPLRSFLLLFAENLGRSHWTSCVFIKTSDIKLLVRRV